LSAIRRAFDLIASFKGQQLTMASVPAEDDAVYDMMCDADTVGVFQIESRAQMAMLPRLAPRTFYDLVIEVAIVRPGPIQGGMVHPYLRRRQGREPVTYPSDAVRRVLERTLGIPIFQEQVMQLAVVAAGFSRGEADQLRRAMAAWKRHGGLGPFEQRLVDGMSERGYSEGFARQIFQQIQGFGEYGFPESHSASFALLVYVSAWLKCHEPAAFTCALLNSQPMGFYAPAQLVADARRHGVEVRPVDVQVSEFESSLECGTNGEPVLRLGLRLVKGLSTDDAHRLVQARSKNSSNSGLGPSPEYLRGMSRTAMARLAAAGALDGVIGHRHLAHWQALGTEPLPPILAGADFDEQMPALKEPTEAQNLVADYASTGLTLGRHPMAILRERFDPLRVHRACDVESTPHRRFVRAAGLVVNRQRPGTASGVIFMTLEDETGFINLVVWPWVVERSRALVVSSRLLLVHGIVEREGKVVHLIAGRLRDYSRWLGQLTTRSRDFH
ncbi:MAG: error-prone DNA polymerase, partial [Chromatiales bacterium]|nr:error-prone DNA polymerase [Chromatiales bacterium]